MRIRTIKPDFFKDEHLCELPPLSRLLFEGLWCLADGEGRLEDRPRYIKVEILPYDECNIEEMLQQLYDKGFIVIYQVDGRRYIHVKNFKKHQRVTGKEAETPSFFPSPDDGETIEKQRGNIHCFTNVQEGKGREGKGKERKGMEGEGKSAFAPAPIQEILVLYHEKCPDLPAVRTMTDARSAAIKARWKDHSELGFWAGFFARVHESDFLCGRAPPTGDRRPFVADFEWLIKQGNFVKIVEGRYDNRRPKQKTWLEIQQEKEAMEASA